MRQYYNELLALQASVPEAYTEKNLEELDRIVRAYTEILNVVSASEQENNTQFYQERMEDLELNLQDAKYGHSEKQRVASFSKAKKDLLAGLTALLNNIREL
jgi:hypothetical protein